MEIEPLILNTLTSLHEEVNVIGVKKASLEHVHNKLESENDLILEILEGIRVFLNETETDYVCVYQEQSKLLDRWMDNSIELKKIQTLFKEHREGKKKIHRHLMKIMTTAVKLH